VNEHACLIDGTAYLFRGYYSVRPVHAADGTPVNAVLGLGNALARLLRDRDPSHVAVAFDAGRYTFRHRIDPAYKANRGDPPEDLVPQFALAQQLTEAMGLATIGVPDFERRLVFCRSPVHSFTPAFAVVRDELIATLDEMHANRSLGARIVSRRRARA